MRNGIEHRKDHRIRKVDCVVYVVERLINNEWIAITEKGNIKEARLAIDNIISCNIFVSEDKVCLNVGVQTFDLRYEPESMEEALWYAKQLKVALKNAGMEFLVLSTT